MKNNKLWKNETVLFSGVDEGKMVAAEKFLGAVEGMKVVPLNWRQTVDPEPSGLRWRFLNNEQS